MNQEQVVLSEIPPDQVRVRKRKPKNSNVAQSENTSTPINSNIENESPPIQPNPSPVPAVSVQPNTPTIIDNVPSIPENPPTQNDSENLSTNPSLAQTPTESPMVVDDPTVGAPVRKRKAKIKTPTSQSNPDFQNDSTSPEGTPVQTNEIPNIKLNGNFSSNDNLSFPTSNSRIGLDIEEDNRIAARYMNPNFDLSRIGKLESKQLLSKSVSRDYADRFTTEMTNQEEEFKRTYVKPNLVDKEQLLNSSFLSKELNDIISQTKTKVQAQTEEFDLDKCSFDDIHLNPSDFDPVKNGISPEYTKTTPETLDLLSGIHQFPSTNELMNTFHLSLTEEKFPSERIIVQEIQTLLQKVTKQTSPNQYMIDLNSKQSFELIEKITLFIVTGLIYSPKYFVDLLYSQMNEDARERANIITFQTALLQAKAELVTINDSYRYAINFVLKLIESAHCSSLIRYLSTAQQFKRDNYYADALVMNSDLCREVALEIEKIECIELKGSISNNSIPTYIPPVEAYRYAIRVENVVNDYISQATIDLLNDDVSMKNTTLLIKVLKLYVQSFLTRKNGAVLPFEELNNIFNDICFRESNDISKHPNFQKFVAIYRKALSMQFDSFILRIWYILTETLNQGILPYILIYAYDPNKNSEAKYFDHESAARIAYAFLPLKDKPFNLDYRTLSVFGNLDL